MSIAKTEGARINEDAYKFADHRTRHVLMVEVVLDDVPGWGDKIEDHVDVIFRSNPYVTAAMVQPVEA